MKYGDLDIITAEDSPAGHSQKGGKFEKFEGLNCVLLLITLEFGYHSRTRHRTIDKCRNTDYTMT